MAQVKHFLLLLAFLATANFGAAQAPRLKPQNSPRPVPPQKYNPAEPFAEAPSLQHSADYLDAVARDWMKSRMCGECHANAFYLMARPLIADGRKSAVSETRKFMEDRIARRERRAPSEVVSIAAALAWDDARTTGKLQPITRQALAEMWKLQKPAGYWQNLGCGDFPPENNRFYTGVLAAVATGVAPDNYAQTKEAKDGLTRLRRFLVAKPQQTHEDQVLFLWASLYMDGLLTSGERQDLIKKILAKQRADGGWSFGECEPCEACAYQKRLQADPKAKPPDTPSSGYATGMTVFVLRQAEVPASHPQIVRGVNWLLSNQRASGRWHTPTETANVKPEEFQVGTRDLAILNAGTAFAVLALKACE
jgi:squalene-hopene/tetraprenyl-beta-curcumene cyclase